MIVTCESNPAEIESLARRCAACDTHSAAGVGWPMLPHLPVGHAVALPVTDEAGGELKMFTIGQRLTTHVRHRQKYVDVPVTESRAFLFGSNGAGARRARTLREFVEALEHHAPAVLDGYVRRGDFSRWIGDVFGDHALAGELRTQERRYRSGDDPNALPEMVSAVRARYDLTEDEVADAVGPDS
jgi:hypothetical protein